MKNKFFNKKNEGIILLLILFSLIIPLTSAVGFSSGYHDKNLLKIGPGETNNFVIGYFQNTENSDKIIKVEIIEGSDIAQFIGDYSSLNVPTEKTDIPMEMKIFIPAEIAEGTEYIITFNYLEVDNSGEGSGMITMAQSKTGSIPVLVEKSATAEQPARTSLTMIWILVIVIIIAAAILIWFFMFRKKNAAEKNSRK